MPNVLRIVVSKAEELLHSFHCCWFWPGTYGFNLVGVRVQATSFNNVPQVLNQLLNKKELLTFHKQLFPHTISQTLHASPTGAIQQWD